MKVKMYMDVYVGWESKYAMASTNPAFDVCTGNKRISFIVDVPDHLITPKADLHIQETSFAEEVK